MLAELRRGHRQPFGEGELQVRKKFGYRKATVRTAITAKGTCHAKERCEYVPVHLPEGVCTVWTQRVALCCNCD